MTITREDIRFCQGANDVERCMSYLRAQPGGDRLSHDELWRQGCELNRELQRRQPRRGLSLSGSPTEDMTEEEAFTTELDRIAALAKSLGGGGVTAAAALMKAIAAIAEQGEEDDDADPDKAVAARRRLEEAMLDVELEGGLCLRNFDGRNMVERAMAAVRSTPEGEGLPYDDAWERGCKLAREVRAAALGMSR